METEKREVEHYSVRYVADVMGVSRTTVFRYIKSGKMKAVTYKGDYFVSEISLIDFCMRHRLAKHEFAALESAMQGLMRTFRK